MVFCEDSNRERGRGNRSFPVAEILKPLGFKERSDVRFPSLRTMTKISPIGIFLLYNRLNGEKFLELIRPRPERPEPDGNNRGFDHRGHPYRHGELRHFLHAPFHDYQPEFEHRRPTDPGAFKQHSVFFQLILAEYLWVRQDLQLPVFSERFRHELYRRSGPGRIG